MIPFIRFDFKIPYPACVCPYLFLHIYFILSSLLTKSYRTTLLSSLFSSLLFSSPFSLIAASIAVFTFFTLLIIL